MTDLKIKTEWAVAQYGLLHVAAPEIRKPPHSKRSATEAADREHSLVTPISRKVVVIDGETFGTAWVRKPTAKQLVEHPNWPKEVPLQ